MTTRMPTYFISHGGGPWPWLPDMRQMLKSLEVSLANMSKEIGVTPKAILMVSGHWEEKDFAVMSGDAPGMVYDYGGFPPFTYQITYAAPGAPELARRTQELIAAAALPTPPDPPQGQGGHGHAQLDDGKIRFHLVQHRAGHPREAIAILGQFRDSGGPRLNDGELSGHEDAVDDDQCKNEDDAPATAHRKLASPRAREGTHGTSGFVRSAHMPISQDSR